MRLFDALQALDADIEPKLCKIHLAVGIGINDPLERYLEDDFDRWQTGQTQRNFERPQILSLIQMPTRHLWLFAGVHDSLGCEQERERLFVYKTERRPGPDGLNGRLVVRFERPGRQSYLRAERWVDSLLVHEIRPTPLDVEEFPGFAHCTLPKRKLDLIVRQQVESWRSALMNVAGVYVIADTSTGMLYVGSATGEEGLWSRWSSYSHTGHGGNAELRALLKERGPEHADHFQFGILEIAGTHAGDVISRECYWKQLLLSRAPFGLNAN